MRIAVVLIAVFAGCASMDPPWTKPGSKPEDFKADNAQCEAQAVERANAVNTMHVTVNYSLCMKGKGWAPPEKPKEESDEPKHEAAKEDAPKH